MSAFKSSLPQSHLGSPQPSNFSSTGMRSFSDHQQMQTQTAGNHGPSHSHASGGAFLPNFLLGGTSPNTSSASYGRSLSSSGYQKSSPPLQNFHSFSSPADRWQSQKRVSPLLHSNLGEKSSNAPPVQGLYDDTKSCGIDELHSNSAFGTTPTRSGMSFSSQNPITPGNASHFDNCMNNSVFSPRPDVMVQSPAQLDPFYTQGESLGTADTLDETWVTIFGFPPSLVAYILEQFCQYGTIERKEIASNVNWLHLKYQTKLQAKKALSKNGKILNGNIMIGVCQCIDKEVMAGSQQDTTCYKSILGTPSSSSVKSPAAKPSSIRPLTAAYQAAASQNKVIQDGKGTPQRNNSIVSKTLEYVFGW